MKAQDISQGQLGPKEGYKQHSNISRILSGRDDDAPLVRVAAALGCEVLLVPKGTPQSVVGRLHDANERELRIASMVLDFLLDFRDEAQAIDYIERDVALLRVQLEERRALLRPRSS